MAQNPQEMIAALQARTRTTEIDGNSVQIQVLPTSEGWVMGTKLAEILAPTLKDIIRDGQDEVNFIDLATAIVSQLDKLDHLTIIKRVLKDVAVNGAGIDFETFFAAKYNLLIQFVAFAMKENFSSFFELGDIL